MIRPSIVCWLSALIDRRISDAKRRIELSDVPTMVGTSIVLKQQRKIPRYIGKKKQWPTGKLAAPQDTPRKNSLIERDQVSPDIQGNQ
jgi:hypothetical protein